MEFALFLVLFAKTLSLGIGSVAGYHSVVEKDSEETKVLFSLLALLGCDWVFSSLAVSWVPGWGEVFAYVHRAVPGGWASDVPFSLASGLRARLWGPASLT